MNLFHLSAADGQAWAECQTAKQIFACNKDTRPYGLTLTEEQAAALAGTCTAALKESRRVAFGGSVVNKLILAFCSSPYLSEDNYEDSLHALIGLFYDLKNDTWDRIFDDDLIAFMVDAFNHQCHGSMELLFEEAGRLSAHIHSGKQLQSFRERKE